jgi:hypothetical protein
MKDRVLKRRASRKRRCLRRDLVHLAGCTEPNCANLCLLTDEISEDMRQSFYRQIRQAYGPDHDSATSVPRSLRPIIGRWL